MLSVETLLSIPVASLVIEQQFIPKIKYKRLFFNLSLHKVDSFHFFLFDFMRVATFDLALALILRGCDLEFFTPYDQFSLLISKSLNILIQ
jgi:hypothetical protein